MTFKKQTFFLILVILQTALLFYCLAVSVSAQASPEKDTVVNENEKVSKILQEMKQELKDSPSFPDSILSPPTSAQQELLNDSTLAMYQDAMYAYYEYRVSGFKHRKEVFAWQLFSSKLIFWCVLLLVFSGICFSGIQFYKSIRLEQTEGDTVPRDMTTEFEATAKGIKVTSPVLGVIILVISLVFFYLYLVYVYPIREIF